MNRFFRSLFAYQLAFVVRPRPTVAHLLDDARLTGLQKLEAHTHQNL